MRLLNLFILVILLSTQINAQNSVVDDRSFVMGKIIDGDTIPHVMLREVTVIPPWKFKSKQEERHYGRLLVNIKKTLPYARMAGNKIDEINRNLSLIENEKEQSRYLKEAERELFKEFETPLRRLTISQGRMLIRLIDRETGATSYELIKEYKGGVPAFFWQGIARIFGSNLKDQYDAQKDDKMVEHIITLLDNGML